MTYWINTIIDSVFDGAVALEKRIDSACVWQPYNQLGGRPPTLSDINDAFLGAEHVGLPVRNASITVRITVAGSLV